MSRPNLGPLARLAVFIVARSLATHGKGRSTNVIQPCSVNLPESHDGLKGPHRQLVVEISGIIQPRRCLGNPVPWAWPELGIKFSLAILALILRQIGMGGALWTCTRSGFGLDRHSLRHGNLTAGVAWR
jgi:hypothetical protein